MSLFRFIIFALPALNVAWWLWADRRLRHLPHAVLWRWLLAAFAAGNVAIYAWVLLARFYGLPESVPTILLGECYIWSLVVLPAAAIVLAADGLLALSRASIASFVRVSRAKRTMPDRAHRTPTASAAPQTPASAPTLSRRQLLAAAAVVLPPALASAGEIGALAQLGGFRVRRLTVALPRLPPALDGLTIAHVSDLHVGRFTHGPILRAVIARTRALQPDLVLFTGDLIDHALADLPAGIDTLRQLAPPGRLFLCEGNHDLFEGRAEFEGRVRSAGLRLLLNESAELEIRGQRVQLLGLSWGRAGSARGAIVDEHMARVLPLCRPDAFTVLLTHHPHAFDPAAAAGIPLTLAGHTHGGQLMLTPSLGAGPLLFKYWSGLYRRGSSALVVSNGVGNWFPLRINAPAEILHLTLRAAPGV